MALTIRMLFEKQSLADNLEMREIIGHRIQDPKNDEIQLASYERIMTVLQEIIAIKEDAMKPGDYAIYMGQLLGSKHDKKFPNPHIGVRNMAERCAAEMFPGDDTLGFQLVFVEMYCMACRQARRERKAQERQNHGA